jgi:hypothetical protein
MTEEKTIASSSYALPVSYIFFLPLTIILFYFQFCRDMPDCDTLQPEEIMTVEQTADMIQENRGVKQDRLTPVEIDYVAELALRPAGLHMAVEGPLKDLPDKLKKEWGPTGNRANEAALLQGRIMDLAKLFSKEGFDNVWVTIHADARPHAGTLDPNTPAHCAVLDAEQGVIRQGWLSTCPDLITGDIPLGMKIICRPATHKVKELWEDGTGAPLEVYALSITQNQQHKAVMAEHHEAPLQRPQLPQLPAFIAAKQN